MQALHRALAVGLVLSLAILFLVFESNGSHISRTAAQTFSSINKHASSTFGASKSNTATSNDAAKEATLTFGKNSRQVTQSLKRYYEQVWAVGDVAVDDELTKLTDLCSRTEWQDDIYLQCGGLQAGITTIYSLLRVCFRMAAEAGLNVVMPLIAQRNSEDLMDFRTFDGDWNLHYDEWFDEAHFRKQMAISCPKMKIIGMDDKKQPDIRMRRNFGLELDKLPGYQPFTGWAWPGENWKDAFHGKDGQKGVYALALEKDTKDNPTGINPDGAYVTSVWTPFLFFRIVADISGFDREVWHELSHLIRAKPKPRAIVSRLMDYLGNTPYIGVHYRAEKDNIWSSAAEQLVRDLQMAEQAWEEYIVKDSRYADKTHQKTIYLACGDQEAIKDFTAEASARGWVVIDKWTIAKEIDATNTEMQFDPISKPDFTSPELQAPLTDEINSLPFDHQGSVDLVVVTLSTFFVGFTGSAFSYTTGNTRDPLGKYRGSSIERPWDAEGRIAATHLFGSGSPGYVCCF